jgi:hypothetical protein
MTFAELSPYDLYRFKKPIDLVFEYKLKMQTKYKATFTFPISQTFEYSFHYKFKDEFIFQLADFNDFYKLMKTMDINIPNPNNHHHGFRLSTKEDVMNRSVEVVKYFDLNELDYNDSIHINYIIYLYLKEEHHKLFPSVQTWLAARETMIQAIREKYLKSEVPPIEFVFKLSLNLLIEDWNREDRLKNDAQPKEI